MKIFTEFVGEKPPGHRVAEIAAALLVNLQNPEVESVVLYSDQASRLGPAVLGDRKLTLLPPVDTLGRIVQEMNIHASPGELVAYCNADISITGDAVEQLKAMMSQYHFATISRHDLGAPAGDVRRGSADFFAWLAPCKIPVGHLQFKMGRCHCDPVLNARAAQVYPHVFNPALDVRIDHHHASGWRSAVSAYDTREAHAVEGERLYVEPERWEI